MAVAFLAVGLLGRGLLRRALLGGGLLGRGLLGRCLLGRLLPGRRPGRPPLGQQLGRPLDGEGLDVIPPAQRGVGRAVGHVGAEPPVLDHHGQTGVGIGAHLTERPLGVAATPGLGLGEQGQGLVDGDRQDLVLRREAPGVGPALEIRPELAVVGDDLLVGLGIGAHHPRDAQQVEGLLEGDGGRRHGGEQRGGAGLRAAVHQLAELHVGAEPPGPDLHRQARLGVLAQDPVGGRGLEERLGPLHRELVGGQVVGDGHPVLPPLQVGPVATHPGHDVLAVGAHADGDGVDLAGVDLPEVGAHLPLEAEAAHLAGHRDGIGAPRLGLAGAVPVAMAVPDPGTASPLAPPLPK